MAMYNASEGKKNFKWNEETRSDCLARIALAAETLKLPEPPERLFTQFVKTRFVPGVPGELVGVAIRFADT